MIEKNPSSISACIEYVLQTEMFTFGVSFWLYLCSQTFMNINTMYNNMNIHLKYKLKRWGEREKLYLF